MSLFYKVYYPSGNYSYRTVHNRDELAREIAFNIWKGTCETINAEATQDEFMELGLFYAKRHWGDKKFSVPAPIDYVTVFELQSVEEELDF